METISIIIPVYNSAAFLSACLDSILAQTYRNTEIILVEDGSEDNSLQICNAYAQKDSRIRVITGTHGGPGAARNNGIRAATGEYIVFADSDDVCEPGLLETLHSNIPKDPGSMAICGILLTDEAGNRTGEFMENYRVLSARHYVSDILSAWKASPLCGGVYSKLYRRELLQDHNILFEEDTTYAEDFCFNLKYLQYVGKIVILPDLLYRYRFFRKGSLTEQNIMNLEFSALWQRLLTVMDQYRILFESFGLEKARVAEIAAFFALQKTLMVEFDTLRAKNFAAFRSDMAFLRNDTSNPYDIPIDRLPGVPVKDLYALRLLEKGRFLTLYLYEHSRKALRRLQGREWLGA